MAPNGFSEFTFGFAFTHEVTTLCWDAVAGPPEMPSLFDEGRGKGFDVALGLWGWTMFAQFKRGERLKRSTAKEWASYHGPYYRFVVESNLRTTQHSDLCELAKRSRFNWVVYVSPVFHSSEELAQHFGHREV